MTAAELEVLEPGLLASVQDLGRPGLLRAGITAGGALDPRALHVGAALLGQEPGLAALEMTLGGGRFRAVGRPVRVALTGARCPATVDGRPVDWLCAFSLRAGEELAVGRPADGVYAYLHLGGGIAVPKVLHARATHLRAGFGGLEGRAVRAGDRLPAGAAARGDAEDTCLEGEAEPPLATVRVLWGVHAEEFDAADRARFVETTFRVSSKRDRMGVRLDGADPFRPSRGLTLISDAVVLGDVQVPGDGAPVVLLADRQPTGGYPRLATVISADLAAFAQLPTGAMLRFHPVAPEAAVEALRAQRDRLAGLPERVRRRAARDPLLTVNLIDGVHDGDSEG